MFWRPDDMSTMMWNQVVTGPGRLGELTRWLRLEAQRLRNNHIGSEHVALAAFDGPDGLAELCLAAGADADELRRRLESRCTDPERYSFRPPQPTPNTWEILIAADREAEARGDEEIRPPDLLRALARQPGCLASNVLLEMGITAQYLLIWVEEIVAQQPVAVVGSPDPHNAAQLA